MSYLPQFPFARRWKCVSLLVLLTALLFPLAIIWLGVSRTFFWFGLSTLPIAVAAWFLLPNDDPSKKELTDAKSFRPCSRAAYSKTRRG